MHAQFYSDAVRYKNTRLLVVVSTSTNGKKLVFEQHVSNISKYMLVLCQSLHGRQLLSGLSPIYLFIYSLTCLFERLSSSEDLSSVWFVIFVGIVWCGNVYMAQRACWCWVALRGVWGCKPSLHWTATLVSQCAGTPFHLPPAKLHILSSPGLQELTPQRSN